MFTSIFAIMDKLQLAFQRFDAYNKKDPNLFTWEGKSYPQEYFFAVKLHEWILKLAPEANEALLLASRSQHIGRWEIARETYPADRQGYLKWRKELALFHADKASEIMKSVGYDEEIISQTKDIILKKKIKVNKDVQMMENALCLVFLAYQYEAFYPLHRDKIVNILRKSLLKMDEAGHAFAMDIQYSEEGMRYIQEALQMLSA